MISSPSPSLHNIFKMTFCAVSTFFLEEDEVSSFQWAICKLLIHLHPPTWIPLFGRKTLKLVHRQQGWQANHTTSSETNTGSSLSFILRNFYVALLHRFSNFPHKAELVSLPHVSSFHVNSRNFSSFLTKTFLINSRFSVSAMQLHASPLQFDQLQKQGNMVYRMREIHMTILENMKTFLVNSLFLLLYVACCLPPEQPLLWQVRPAASNCCPSRTSLNPICAQIHKYTRLQIQILFNTQIHATKTIEIQMNFSQHIFT